MYKFFIEDDESIEDYINWIRQDTKWAGQLEMNALSQIYKFNVIVHQVDNPSMAQEFFPWGSVPCLHVSYHLGEHYNSVRLATDPCQQPAIDYPIGHELKEIEQDQEETKADDSKTRKKPE